MTWRTAPWEVTPMSWFRRMVDRVRNYFSRGDWPGSHGSGGGGSSSHDEARFMVERERWSGWR
jgi:hypothetical protein